MSTENGNGFEAPHPEGGDAAENDARIDKLKAIVRILEDSTLASLEYEDEDIEVRLSRYPEGQPVVAAAAPAPIVAPTLPVAPAAGPDTESGEDFHVVKSPFVGTFYRSPSPEADPFVSIGATVEPKMALCIVEAMKLMNHIESDVKGVVREILVENGQAVEYGQPLFKISVSS